MYIPARDIALSDPWANKAPLPDARYAAGVTNIAGNVYVLGGIGEYANGRMLQYSPQNDNWMILYIPNSSPWTHLGFTSIETFLYALGGEVDNTKTSQHLAYKAIYTIFMPVME